MVDVQYVKSLPFNLYQQKYCYRIEIPMKEGDEWYAFIDKDDLDSLKEDCIKNNLFIHDYGEVDDINDRYCIYKRVDGTQFKATFADYLGKPDDCKGQLCVKISTEKAIYWALVDKQLGFQKIKVDWKDDYPFLFVNGVEYCMLFPNAHASEDGIGIEKPGILKYTKDAYSPNIRKKRYLRDRMRDTGFPIPY